MNQTLQWPLPFPSLPHPQEAGKDKFSTEAFLHALFIGDLALEDPAVIQVLDRFCKKLDVLRKLRAFYAADLGKNAKPIASVRSEYMSFCAALLLKATEENKDLKFLNSVLKMLDNGLILQPEHVPALRQWANRLVVELVP